MGVYSIKDLENFTQIKAHTLRIWEQRYALLSPQRTETNIRLYSDQDLKKILNINLLYNNGLKISKIAKLDEGDITKLANEILMGPNDGEVCITDQFINRIIRFDEYGIQKNLELTIQKEGMEGTFTNVLVPILKKIGELWQVDTISAAHEHFFSNIIRDFLIRHTKMPEEKEQREETVLLFLREEEYHELGLLFYNYYLRARGYRTIYLGQALPSTDLERILREVKPTYLFTSLIAKMDEDQFVEFFRQVSVNFDLKNLFVGGFQLSIFEKLIPKGVRIIHTADGIDL